MVSWGPPLFLVLCLLPGYTYSANVTCFGGTQETCMPETNCASYNCTDIDECALMTDGCNVTNELCVNTYGAYECGTIRMNPALIAQLVSAGYLLNAVVSLLFTLNGTATSYSALETALTLEASSTNLAATAADTTNLIILVVCSTCGIAFLLIATACYAQTRLNRLNREEFMRSEIVSMREKRVIDRQHGIHVAQVSNPAFAKTRSQQLRGPASRQSSGSGTTRRTSLRRILHGAAQHDTAPGFQGSYVENDEMSSLSSPAASRRGAPSHQHQQQQQQRAPSTGMQTRSHSSRTVSRPMTAAAASVAAAQYTRSESRNAGTAPHSVSNPLFRSDQLMSSQENFNPMLQPAASTADLSRWESQAPSSRPEDPNRHGRFWSSRPSVAHAARAASALPDAEQGEWF